MIKTFSTKAMGGQAWLIIAFSCLFALSALAQTVSPAPGIGTPPANSKQGKIIHSALSSKTRQTLQEAMDSASTADSTNHAK